MVVNIIFGIWVVVCIISWYWQNKLYKTIEKLFPDKWSSLGRPRISMMWEGFSIISPSKGFSLLGDMLKSGFKTAGYFIKGDMELDSNFEILRLKKINQRIFLLAIGVLITYIVIPILYYGFFTEF